jgi:hypothetical protein
MVHQRVFAWAGVINLRTARSPLGLQPCQPGTRTRPPCARAIFHDLSGGGMPSPFTVSIQGFEPWSPPPSSAVVACHALVMTSRAWTTRQFYPRVIGGATAKPLAGAGAMTPECRSTLYLSIPVSSCDEGHVFEVRFTRSCRDDSVCSVRRNSVHPGTYTLGTPVNSSYTEHVVPSFNQVARSVHRGTPTTDRVCVLAPGSLSDYEVRSMSGSTPGQPGWVAQGYRHHEPGSTAAVPDPSLKACSYQGTEGCPLPQLRSLS